MEFSNSNSLPIYVQSLLSEKDTRNGLGQLLESFLEACREIGTKMRNNGYRSNVVGSLNTFGDKQLEVDVKTDIVMFDACRQSGVVHVASSEETPEEIPCFVGKTDLDSSKGYSTAFDPLDGSSIVDCNFAVGTICGIWNGKGLLGKKGSEQCASFVCMYGPRVTIIIALNKDATKAGAPIAFELTMNPNSWDVTIPLLQIEDQGTTFAPGNLRATTDNPNYKACVDYWFSHKYTLRYSGGLVPDIYHILIKGQGVLSNASSPSAKAKLRLLYEAAPIALIIEAAGGSSCACASEAAEPCEPVSLLQVPISQLDKRVGVCYGSSEEVDRFKSYMFPVTAVPSKSS
jgi:sedoheptulose-bisphosphatase